jgi:hypothetical protein
MGYRSDIQLQAQLVQFDTQLPYDDVIARLQSQMINKDVSTQLITRFREARTQEDVEEIVGDTTRGLDFLYVRVYQFGSRFSLMFYLTGISGSSNTTSYWISTEA